MECMAYTCGWNRVCILTCVLLLENWIALVLYALVLYVPVLYAVLYVH